MSHYQKYTSKEGRGIPAIDRESLIEWGNTKERDFMTMYNNDSTDGRAVSRVNHDSQVRDISVPFPKSNKKPRAI